MYPVATTYNSKCNGTKSINKHNGARVEIMFIACDIIRVKCEACPCSLVIVVCNSFCFV